MGKSYKKYDRVEEQKGPIDLKEQFTSKFMTNSERTMRDIVNNEMRRSGQTMDFHTPKR